MITLSDFKMRLRRLLKEREDMSLEDIAQAAGVSLSTARRWCNPADSTDPGFHAVVKVTSRYKLSLDRLVATHKVDPLSKYADAEKLWRANMDWWEANLSAEQKELILTLIRTIWHTADKTLTAQDFLLEPAECKKTSPS